MTTAKVQHNLYGINPAKATNQQKRKKNKSGNQSSFLERKKKEKSHFISSAVGQAYSQDRSRMY